MAEDKSAQRQRVIYGFGLLIQPLKELSQRDPLPSANDYRIAIGMVQSGDGDWRRLVREFTTLAPDVRLEQEFQGISHVPERLRRDLVGIAAAAATDPAEAQTKVSRAIETAERRFFRLINEVPIDGKPVIFPANTPFTAYRKISETLAAGTARLHYFDRYLKPSFFDLFLHDVPRGIEVRLITTRSGAKAVNAVSELAAGEFTDYELIEVDPSRFHDRNLRVDDKIFTLGPGVDRAGIHLTNFGPADSSPTAHAELDSLISAGRRIHVS